MRSCLIGLSINCLTITTECVARSIFKNTVDIEKVSKNIKLKNHFSNTILIFVNSICFNYFSRDDHLHCPFSEYDEIIRLSHCYPSATGVSNHFGDFVSIFSSCKMERDIHAHLARYSVTEQQRQSDDAAARSKQNQHHLNDPLSL